MKKFVFVLLAAVAVAAPAFAEDAQPAATQAPVGAAAPAAAGDAAADTSYLDRVVCKNLPPPTGTMLGSRKVCQTERQWRELTKTSQDRINTQQQKLGGYGGPSN
jgi:hypothetical protein